MTGDSIFCLVYMVAGVFVCGIMVGHLLTCRATKPEVISRHGGWPPMVFGVVMSFFLWPLVVYVMATLGMGVDD